MCIRDRVYTAASELLRVSPEIVETVGREAVDFGTVPSVIYEGKTYLYLSTTKTKEDTAIAALQQNFTSAISA